MKNKIVTATDGEFSFVENSPIIKVLKSPTGMFINTHNGIIHSGEIVIRVHYFDKDFHFLGVPRIDSEEDWEIYYG
jgi:hypothetical protein